MYTLCIYYSNFSKQRSFVGTMEGELKPMDYESDSEEEISTHEEQLHNGTESSR